MKGGPRAWGEGAAERRYPQWPWEAGGEFPLRRPRTSLGRLSCTRVWGWLSRGRPLSRTGLGIKCVLGGGSGGYAPYGMPLVGGAHRTLPRQQRGPPRRGASLLPSPPSGGLGRKVVLDFLVAERGLILLKILVVLLVLLCLYMNKSSEIARHTRAINLYQS